MTTLPLRRVRISRRSGAWRVLKLLRLALVLLVGGAGNWRLAAQWLGAEEKETQIIRGTVVNSITHEPIGRALVYSPDNRFAVMSDPAGHFEFKIPRAKSEIGTDNRNAPVAIIDRGDRQYLVANGPNVLMAKKPGFLTEQNISPFLPLSNEAEQEITIPLVPEALVVGRVNLATADGTDKLHVELYRRQIQDGREIWNSAGIAQARSDGEFRFAGLYAGTYKVFTHEEMDRDPLTFNPRGQLYGYPPVFYPSSSDFATASAIRVPTGGTVSVSLTPTRREYYPVKVAVANPPKGAGMQIGVWPQGRQAPGYSLGYNQAEQSIEGTLPDGDYTIEVNTHGPYASSAQINISVKGRGVEGAVVRLVPNGSIQVEVKQEFTRPEMTSQMSSFEENGKPVSKEHFILSATQVILFRTDEISGGMAVGARARASPEDESLLIENVPPGRYRVQVNAPMGYVAAVGSGGTDLLQSPLVVPMGGTSSPLEITLRDDGGSVEGTIENWPAQTQRGNINPPGQPPSCVYLVPLSGGARRPPIAYVSQDGSFSLQQIPPGMYRAIAFDRQPVELEFTNEEAMKKYEPKSQVVEFGAGEKKQLRLPLNSASE